MHGYQSMHLKWSLDKKRKQTLPSLIQSLVLIWALISTSANKTTVKVYQELFLEAIVKPLKRHVFQNQPCTFHRDPALAHNIKAFQIRLRNNFKNIELMKRVSDNSNLNSTDYKMSIDMEDMVYHKRYPNKSTNITTYILVMDNIPVDIT